MHRAYEPRLERPLQVTQNVTTFHLQKVWPRFEFMDTQIFSVSVCVVGLCVCHPRLTCVCSHMPFEVKRVVESFATVSTGVSLHQAVTLQVTSQHSLQRKYLVARWANKVSRSWGITWTRLVERNEKWAKKGQNDTTPNWTRILKRLETITT